MPDINDSDARAREWRLGAQQWALFHAVLASDGTNPRLASLLARRGAAIAAAGLAPPAPLASHHSAQDFDCGIERLNDPRRPSADSANPLDTRVVADRDRIAAYYATRPLFALRGDAPEAPPTGLHLVARFAIDRRYRTPGLAHDLFAHLLHSALTESPVDRMQAVVGFAVSPSARRFFMRCGARPAGDMVDPCVILVSAADMARVLGG